MDRLDQGAALLAAARLEGHLLASLPDDCRPADIAEGYALQFRLQERLAGTLGPVAGWKIGCTTPVMQAYLGIDRPSAGGVYRSTILASPASLPHAAFRGPGVECEVAFRLGSDLPPLGAPYTADRVAGAVAAAFAAIEVVDARYADFRSLGAPTLIADDFFNAGLVLGSDVTDWRRLDLAAAEGVTLVDGREVGRGRGRDVMGHPLNALAWLADHLAATGRPLRAGMVVTTGSIVAVHWVAAPATVTVRIGDLGEASLRFA